MEIKINYQGEPQFPDDSPVLVPISTTATHGRVARLDPQSVRPR
jgi:hypothetical protein